jgi:hypothetical protein
MKTTICLLLTGIGINFADAQTEHDWKATLKVVDETSEPVEDAKVEVSYDMSTNAIVGLTDTNGIFTASHHNASENLGFYAKKSGYYSFRAMYHMGRSFKLETWNPTQIIFLKRIIHPIPMYAQSVNLDLPVFDKPAGFDLMIGDWVAPYGNGVSSDFIFTAHREKRAPNDTDYKLAVSFPNKGDGIQEFSIPTYYLHDKGSALRSVQVAPADRYQHEWAQTKTRRPGKPIETNWKIDQNYYFRVRTILDEQGNVKSALYGKIYGDFMDFSYYLNPTLNSRNVEFDPKQNLMKDLKFDEGVSDP